MTTPAPPHDEKPSRGGAAFLLRALRYRNYRLYFTGQSVSLIGTWMTRIATSWLVFRLTHSALLLGTVSFAGQIPAFLFGPLAGVVVDRVDRHRLLVLTQALAMVQSLLLAALTLTGRITLAQIIALSAFQGVINAFDTPARQSFVITTVERREDLGNAIALNSSMVNGARLLGPSLAGVVIGVIGEGWCFLLDGVSYLAVIASLLLMVLPRRAPRGDAPEPQRPRAWAQIAEGWRYVSGFAPIRSILLLLAVVSLVGMPYTVLMPVFATQTLHGGPRTLGLLMAATGVGALGGALYLASRPTVLGLGRLIPLTAALFGAGLIALPLLMLTGPGFMVQMASSNTLLQTIVEEDKRGRVMSFYTMAFMGTTPFGSLLAGVSANRIGAPLTLALGGVGCLIGPLVRPDAAYPAPDAPARLHPSRRPARGGPRGDPRRRHPGDHGGDLRTGSPRVNVLSRHLLASPTNGKQVAITVASAGMMCTIATKPAVTVRPHAGRRNL
jgi:MFS family permease